MDRLGNGPVPRNLDRYIREKGLKKGFVANQAGLSVNELSAILNNRRRIRACEILFLSKALGVTPADLLSE